MRFQAPSWTNLAQRPARLMFSAPWSCTLLPQLREVCTSVKRSCPLMFLFCQNKLLKSLVSVTHKNMLHSQWSHFHE